MSPTSNAPTSTVVGELQSETETSMAPDPIELPEPPAVVGDVLERWHQAHEAGEVFKPGPGEPNVMAVGGLTAAHLGCAIEVHLVAQRAREAIRLGRYRVDIINGVDIFTLIADAPGAHVSVKVPATAFVLVYPK